MLFKMILEGAKESERPIARGFLKHIVMGIGASSSLIERICKFIAGIPGPGQPERSIEIPSAPGLGPKAR